jgi:hypothetical protein
MYANFGSRQAAISGCRQGRRRGLLNEPLCNFLAFSELGRDFSSEDFPWRNR